jgi:hypothetical protein
VAAIALVDALYVFIALSPPLRSSWSEACYGIGEIRFGTTADGLEFHSAMDM